MDTNTQALIAIIGGLWAAVNAGYSGAKISNERRDLVLIGNDGKNDLSISHRRLILYNDWLPMTLVSGFTSLVFAGFVAAVPFITKADSFIVWLCAAVSIVPFVAAVSLLIGAAWEFHMMTQVLSASQVAPATHMDDNIEG